MGLPLTMLPPLHSTPHSREPSFSLLSFLLSAYCSASILYPTQPSHLFPPPSSSSILISTHSISMEKSRSVPKYSSSYHSFGYEDGPRSYNFNGPSSSNDPEIKRKRRVASYNVLTMEAKLKSSVRNSFKWIKTKFTDIRYTS